MKEKLISSLLKKFQSEEILVSTEDEQTRRIDYLIQLLNDLFEHFHSFSNHLSFLEIEPNLNDYIKRWNEILSSGKRNEPHQNTDVWQEWENGIILLHKVLYKTTVEGFSTYTTPAHLFMFEIVNVSTRQYDYLSQEGGWEISIFILTIFSFGLEYLLNETKHNLQTGLKVRWKRVKSLMSDSSRVIHTVLSLIKSDSDEGGNSNGEDAVQEQEKILNPSIIFILKQYLLPSFYQLISIHPDSQDSVIDVIGLLSFAISCFQQTEHIQSGIELCVELIKFATISSSSNQLTFDHILYHPLRSQAFVTYRKRREAEYQRKKHRIKNLDMKENECSDDWSDMEESNESLYSKDKLLNKLADVTESGCDSNIPWSDVGLAMFAFLLLQQRTNRPNDPSRIELDFPSVYSPSHYYKLFFPHTCTLYLHVSRTIAMQYLHSLMQFTFSPADIPRIPKKIIVNTCQLLINLQSKESIQLLQEILTRRTQKTISIHSIGKLIDDCPYPNAIPVLLDLLRVYIGDTSDKSNEKAILRIVHPFVSEMEEFNGDYDHLLQMYEIYICVLTLLRRMLLQERKDHETHGNQTKISEQRMDEIEKAWVIAKSFLDKVKKAMKESKEDGFRLFLLQDALEQFTNEGKQQFDGIVLKEQDENL